MGSNMAYDLAESDLIDLDTQIRIHLTSNHYPPVPVSMSQACLDAIDAYWEEDYNREITLPEGVSYKGLDVAPAWAIVEAHHLDAWLPQE